MKKVEYEQKQVVVQKKTVKWKCEICGNETKQQDEDLMQDFISVITSFCSRIYGQRRCKIKTEQIIKELEQNDTVN